MIIPSGRRGAETQTEANAKPNGATMTHTHTVAWLHSKPAWQTVTFHPAIRALLGAAQASPVRAQNPAFRGWHADPEEFILGGTCRIKPTVPGESGEPGPVKPPAN